MSDAPRWPGADGKSEVIFGTVPPPEASSEQEETTSIASAETPSFVEPINEETTNEETLSFVEPTNAETTYAEPASASEVPDFDAPQQEQIEPIPTFVTRDKPLVPPESLPGVADFAGYREPIVTSESDLPADSGPRPRRTRKARLRLARIDPWSVMKTSFLFSIAFGVMLVVAAFALWSVLASSGALESANTFINILIGDPNGTNFDIEQYLSMNRVMGLTVVLAAIDVVILTALATLFSFLYNLAATVLGGLEVTLAED
ncbi:MAG TPA: DUF3566 domain-containing protein [Arachnia sp.]|nr:DUF3566 domain-containing protein [Arachnia sp.]HMT85164.1 DUF3566 domain-containing protein [Arachnia sp.]